MAGKLAAAAVSRFGLGAAPGEIETAARNPKRWVLEQLDAPFKEPAAFSGFPTTVDQGRNYNYRYNELGPRIERAQREAKASGDAAAIDAAAKAGDRMLSGYVQWVAEMTQMEWAAQTNVALTTRQPFVERLTRFWSNHLVVPTVKQPSAVLAGAYEREAIRPHVAGKFSDMLMASAKNAGMLIFLDNNISVGPNSLMAKRSGLGLNENLGREILELHTLGVEGGYTQADVIALAKGITGWSTSPYLPVRIRRLQAPIDPPTGPLAFAYFADWHEPGPITLLGKTYQPTGLAQGEDMLNDLARHPSTARFLATKLARHFVADEPPKKLVDRMAKAYLARDTDLAEMTRVLVDSDEAWDMAQSKLRQPEDYVLATLRSLGLTVAGGKVPVPRLYSFEEYEFNRVMWRESGADASIFIGALAAGPEKAAATQMAEGGDMAGAGSDRMKAETMMAAPGGRMDAAGPPRGGVRGGPAQKARAEVATLFNTISAMGQTPMRSPGPQGWYDRQSDWSGADSVVKRVEWAFALAHAHQASAPDPRDFLDQTIGELASRELKSEIARASSKAQAIGLVLGSPEFQRR